MISNQWYAILPSRAVKANQKDTTAILGIMRRVAVGNFVGAKKCWYEAPADLATLERYENSCVCALQNGQSVPIREVVSYITEVSLRTENIMQSWSAED